MGVFIVDFFWTRPFDNSGRATRRVTLWPYKLRKKLLVCRPQP